MAWPWVMIGRNDDDGSAARRAPAPPPPAEAFAFGVPANPDAADMPVNLAVEFAVTAGGTVTGIDWTTPLGTPGVLPIVSLWNEDTASLMASRVVAVVTPGVVQRVLFAAPVAVVAGVNYQAQVWTDRLTATNSYPSWPVVTAHMATATTNPGRFLYAAGPALATNTNLTCYFVSPVGVF